jgi:MinD-like ATPase involved in chromosome partitioning or flagellar assembly
MKTFDQIVPEVQGAFDTQRGPALDALGDVIVNRDLNGRVRLILNGDLRSNESAMATAVAIVQDLYHRLGHKRAYPSDRAIIFNSDIASVRQEAPWFPLAGHASVSVVDRLATEGNWSSIIAEASGAPRIVFYSIKGGVGRSTALAATAWTLAQKGKRVLVLDLDLESPGVSTTLLPEEKRPAFGITDWLVEDLIDNADAVFDSMVATSDLSHDGEIFIVPAHGVDPGEYVSKLGRVWMSKAATNGDKENWSQRLQRLIEALERRWEPDVILIDSRAGIDEVASSCVTDLGANLVLLFSLEGSQTWTGYKILFDHWLRAHVVEAMRERLQVVAALTPETERIEYLDGLRDNAYDLFASSLYDDIPAGGTTDNVWHFESTDDSAPHSPWEVKWNRGFAALRSLHGRIATIDQAEVQNIFGPLVDGIVEILALESNQ